MPLVFNIVESMLCAHSGGEYSVVAQELEQVTYSSV